MKQEQNDFDTLLDNLSKEVTEFESNVEFSEYEEIATKARALNEKLKAATAQAKQYNKNESLTGLEETVYDSIKESVQTFTPFFELWTTIDNWEKCMKSWLNDDFLTINPSVLEETVGDSQRLINKNLKYFRNKDMPKISKVAEVIALKI